jgi:endo-1,4-beta-xylanase
MINRRKFIQTSALTASAIALAKSKAIANITDNRGLKDYFKTDFNVGVAFGNQFFDEKNADLRELVKLEFNSISPENELKWERVHPEEDKWNWEYQDKFVEFGVENNMHILGHVLVWHSQVPRSVFLDKNGKQVSKEVLTQRMNKHITTVMERYKGKIHAWDVVNESITPEDGYRKSKWFEIMGPEFMENAFNLAHEIDPACHLLYNDYGMDNKKRRNFVVDLVNKYKQKGIPIHGIGMQGHLNLDSPNLAEWEKSIEAFAATGMRVHITELDVDVLPYDWGRTAEVSTNIEYRKSLNPYTEGLPKDIEDKFTKRYEAIFKLLLKHRDKVDRVTFWGTSDDYSWKNNFPVRGRTNYPMLFDRNHQRKEAYYAVTGLKK